MSRLHEMARQSFEIASALTAASVRHPRRTLALWLAVTAALAFQAAQLRSEVGYAAYFGPHDAAVERLESFFSEFDSGLHVLVAFSCPGERVCTSFRESGALELLGGLQAEIDALPNVLRTRSLLNTPIVIGPLETHTIGRRVEGGYALASDWEPLIARSAGEPFLAELVISKDERTAGVVVELQSLDSDRVREFVHRLLELVPRFERTLGGEVFVAGDPVWTVLADDDLDADSRNLTLLMFAVITALLWIFFRSVQLVVLPLVAAGILAIAVHGVVALFGFPMTAILAALPPLLLVIALISSIHLISARLRSPASDEGTALVAAGREIGAPCIDQRPLPPGLKERQANAHFDRGHVLKRWIAPYNCRRITSKSVKFAGLPVYMRPPLPGVMRLPSKTSRRSSGCWHKNRIPNAAARRSI